MLFSDLREIKSILDIDPENTAQDKMLNFYNEWAAGLIEEMLGRKGRLFKKSRTEYYKGTGTQKLTLRSRPVFTSPTIQLWEDEGAYYGSADDAFDDQTALTYGTDFALQLDQDDGTSRSGILFKINGYWERPQIRSAGLLSPFQGESFGSIKITYTGGYTVDTLPADFRFAANLLIMRLSYMMPLGMNLTSESYEGRSISFSEENKDYLLQPIRNLLFAYQNWKF